MTALGRLVWRLTVVLLVLAATAGPATPAAAQPSTQVELPTLTLDPTEGTPGTPVNALATGYGSCPHDGVRRRGSGKRGVPLGRRRGRDRWRGRRRRHRRHPVPGPRRRADRTAHGDVAVRRRRDAAAGGDLRRDRAHGDPRGGAFRARQDSCRGHQDPPRCRAGGGGDHGRGQPGRGPGSRRGRRGRPGHPGRPAARQRGTRRRGRARRRGDVRRGSGGHHRRRRAATRPAQRRGRDRPEPEPRGGERGGAARRRRPGDGRRTR